MQAVLLRQAVALKMRSVHMFRQVFDETNLMNGAPGKVEQVSRVEHSVQYRLTHLSKSLSSLDFDMKQETSSWLKLGELNLGSLSPSSLGPYSLQCLEPSS